MAEKAHAAGKRTGGVGFLRIWLFCQIIRSFRNQPVKVALIGPILQYPGLFKLFLSKGFGDGGGHLAGRQSNGKITMSMIFWILTDMFA